MSPSTSASCTGCVAVLTQQQQEALHHHCDSENATVPAELRFGLIEPRTNPTKLCTVVENGRVVVRPIQPDASK